LKAKIVDLIASVQMLMRSMTPEMKAGLTEIVPLILVNALMIIYLLLLG
jgi:Na+-translocating ferredoxin:NAD+ oxidoreductase RnfE subunit